MDTLAAKTDLRVPTRVASWDAPCFAFDLSLYFTSVNDLGLSAMDISFALTGKGYVIVASDTTAARSIVKMKVDEDKIKVLSPHLLMAYSGEPGR